MKEISRLEQCEMKGSYYALKKKGSLALDLVVCTALITFDGSSFKIFVCSVTIMSPNGLFQPFIGCQFTLIVSKSMEKNISRGVWIEIIF